MVSFCRRARSLPEALPLHGIDFAGTPEGTATPAVPASMPPSSVRTHSLDGRNSSPKAAPRNTLSFLHSREPQIRHRLRLRAVRDRMVPPEEAHAIGREGFTGSHPASSPPGFSPAKKIPSRAQRRSAAGSSSDGLPPRTLSRLRPALAENPLRPVPAAGARRFFLDSRDASRLLLHRQFS